MFIASLNAFRKAWGKFPAFLALVALLASTLVAVDVPEVAQAAGTSSCTTTNTYTASNGYCTVTFTTAGTDSWTVPANVDSIDVLAVGGGGGSNRGICSYTYGAGGGGGGVLEVLGKSVTSGTVLSIVVGGGGTGTNANCVSLATATSSPFTSPSGGNTSITTTSGSSVNLIANGGGGSRTQNNFATAASSGSISIDGVVTAGTAGGSFNWDTSGGCTQTDCANGGGGGAGAAASGMNGGTGKTSVITGNSYGGGGGGTKGGGDGSSSSGGASAAACDAPANRGGGGSDCHKLGTARGGNGGSGIVVIRYLVKPTLASQPADATVTNSPTRTATFSVGAVTTAASLTSPTVTYQWQESTDNGASWTNVSTGTGGTTNSYTTPVLSTTAKNGTKYRAKVTQTSGSVSNFTYSSVATLGVTTDATAPGAVTAIGANDTELAVGWSAPTVNGSAVITGYSIVWSTTSDFATSTTVNTGSTNTFGIVSNLTANTTYYVKVYATGASWSGTVSSVASGTTKASTTQISISTTSSAVEGTDYVVLGGGLLVLKTATSLSISATALQNLLATKDITLSAYRINFNTAVTWSANTKLTVGTHYSTSVYIYYPITASGDTAGIKFSTTAYSLWPTGYSPKILLTGANPTFTVGSQSYTVVNTLQKLSAVTAASKWVLGQNINLTTNYSTAVLNFAFTGEFDGLGNAINNMDITVGSSGSYGFFASLGGTSKVRNVVFNNVKIRNSTESIQKRIGALAGHSTASNGTIDHISVNGTIIETATSGNSEIGGVLGGVTSGTTIISTSNSLATIISGAPELAIGGILGTNVASYASVLGTGGGTVTVKQSWNSGEILRTNYGSWNAIGGIMGVHFGAAATLTNNFNIGNIKSTGSDTSTNIGSILGYSRTGTVATVTSSYTSLSSCGAGTITTCTTDVVPGAQITFPSYWTKNATYGTYPNLSEPTSRNLYIQVVAPTNGNFSGLGYKIVNGLGEEVNSTALAGLNLTVTGTPTYTIDGTTADGDYQVDYVSGLTTGGSAAAIYKLKPWREPTAVSLGMQSQTIAFDESAPTGKRVGDTYETAATATSGLPVTYSVTSPSVCSISGSTITFITAGTCVVAADQAGNSSFQSAPQVTQEITVGKGLQAITISSTVPTTAVFGESGYTPAATGGNSGNEVTFTVDISSVAVCSITNGVVSYIGAGTCLLNADQAGDDNYEAASQEQQSFVVSKAAQTISFTSSVPTGVVLGDTYDVSATGGDSGNEVTFALDISSVGVCSISGSTVTFIGAGTCKVNANQAGADNYFAASQMQQSISVGKGTQAISFTSAAPVDVRVGDTGYTPTATGGSSSSTLSISVAGLSSGVCSMSAGVVTFNTAGSCVLEANQAGDDNYEAATTETQIIVVGRALQAITKTSTDPLDAVVDGADYTPTATGGDSGNAIEVTISISSVHVCTVLAGTITFIGAGNCDYILSQAGNENYEDAAPLTETIVVSKGSQSITFTSIKPTSAVVGGSSYTPSAVGGGTGHPVNLWIALSSNSVCTIADGVVQMIGVGTCLIEASQNGDNNYEAAPIASESFLVSKGSQSISFTSLAPSSAVVGGVKYTPTATGGSTGNAVTFSVASATSSVCSITAGKVSFLTPGDCVIEANQAGNSNYFAASEVTQTISVAKGSQTISFTSNFSGAKVGGSTYTPVAIGGASGEAVNFTIDSSSSAVCTIASGSISFHQVGNCVINANQSGSSFYNAAAQVQQTISVAKGTQVITFTSTPPHNAQVQGLSYTPTAESNNSGTAITYSVPQSAQEFCTIANGIVSFHSVGDCVLYADQAGNSNWNAATRVSQIFNVTKGQQVVTITSTAPTDARVSGTPYTISATGGSGSQPVTYSISELSTDVCSVSSDTVTFQQVGECQVVASQAGDAQFNAANPQTISFAVTKGESGLVFNTTPASPKVDDNGYTPGISVSFNTSSVIYSTADATICEYVESKVVFHKAADCTLYADQPGDANFEQATRISQTFSVGKGNQAPLTPHTSIDFLSLGDGNSPTTVLSLSGGSGSGSYGWSVAANSANICSVTDDVIQGISVGVCEIDIVRLGDDNYLEITDTLQITVSSGNQAPVTVRVSNENATFSPGLELGMSLVGGAGGGSVWYESTTQDICITDGGDGLQILHAGTCTIVGHKDGDGTYLAVQDSLTFYIQKAEVSGVIVAIANDLTYSSTGAVSSQITVSGVASTGAQNMSISQGTCTIENGELVATEAGNCDLQFTVEADQDYLNYSVTTTFVVAKAAQSNLTAARAVDTPEQISYVGTTTTTYVISGGSGSGARELSIEDPAVCSANFQDDNVNITGEDAGMCRVTVTQLSDENYAAASTIIEIRIYDLPDAPTALSVTNTGVANSDGMGIAVAWVAPAANPSQIPLSGYQVQAYIDGAWTDVTGGLVDSSVTSQTVRIPAWNTIKLRVAAVSPIDPSTNEDRKWTYFTGTGPSDQPAEIKVPGELRLISTAVAAVTSGEVVTLTGSGFEVGLTTQVELSSNMRVFTAGIRIAAVANRIVVPATVISETKLTFVLPKIKLPAGQTNLATQVKVLSNNGIATLPATFSYIPKKLTQVMTVAPALPAATTVIDVGSPLTTASVITSTGLAPVITATPAGVCTAALNNQNRLVITPVSPGKCSISVQLPGTPGYTASAAKTTTVNIKQARSTSFMVAARDVAADGTLGAPHMFTQADTLFTAGEINVVVGDEPLDVQVGMEPRQGTVVFKVDPADEAAGRCTADAGDQATTGPFGSIMITDIGDCRVTITNPADSGWYQGHTIKLVVHATARPSGTTVQPSFGEGTESAEDTDLDPLDPDTEPAVAVNIDPTRTSEYAFGGEEGLKYDPLTGKLSIVSRTAYVGVWTATVTSPSVDKKWFKIPGKIVKKVQTYTYSNVCKLTMTVKKDKKIKKKVTRLVGAGCLLTSSSDKIGGVPIADNGKAALTAQGIQKIKVKYKRIRQYANTGLSYRGTAKAPIKVIKNLKRTWVLKVGRN